MSTVILLVDAAPPASIVNGSKVKQGELPYMVQIKLGKFHHYCGGALLSEWHVLTAAHCVETFANDPAYLTLTTHSLRTSGWKGHDHDVERIIYHDKYNSTIGLDHDIAVIKVFKFNFRDKII